MQLPELLLILLLFLALAVMVTGLGKFLRLPYTVLLVLIGLALNVLAPLSPYTALITEFRLTHDLVLFVFLPGLIFDSALSLDARALLKDLVPVLVMAIPGMLISAVLVGLGLVFSINLDLTVALLFGALISATDPVAVIALFKELGVNRRLTVLVEGESLLNDATAIVLFNILLVFIVQDGFLTGDIFTAATDFIKVFFGGIVVGVVLGVVISELIVRLKQSGNSVVLVATLIMAYLSFIVAEQFFHVSGVMSVLSAALFLSATGLPRLSEHSEQDIREFWAAVALIFNSLLFIMIGLSVDIGSLLSSWEPVLWAMLAVAIARAASVYGLIPLTTFAFALPKIKLDSQHVMWWGGLKGGLAIAIVFSIPDTVAEKQLLTELTLGVVLISLLVNASMLRPLLHWLKVDRLSEEEWLEWQQSKVRVKRSIEQVLHDFSSVNLLDGKLESSVVSALRKNLQSKSGSLSEAQLLKQVHLQVLQSEEEELERLSDIGLVNYYNYLNFKDILTKDKAKSSVELVLPQPERQASTNPFLRFEMAMIKYLSEYNWTLCLLVKYQSSRFSNLIRHDIAGALLAHEALLKLKQFEQSLPGRNLDALKTIYQDRLNRRQGRLKQFSLVFPDFYHQYEYRLFQEVALLYSLECVTDEHEHGKLSTKVFRRLEKSLMDAQKQLPSMTANLSLVKRDNWLDSVPLFSGLPKAVISRLAKNAHYISFLPEDTVFNEGDKGDSVYILVSGSVNVFKRNERGESFHAAELRKGSFIGEHALSAKSIRTATVRAKTYITLLRLTADEVVALSKDAPELAMRLRDAEFGHYA
ncbi:MAG: cation:proton antiporter [Methylobacter sp.]|jgi:CPA1 family monovalent cation:H+ antiporter|nr:cation:proton antiporter [Methylobacter sp.]